MSDEGDLFDKIKIMSKDELIVEKGLVKIAGRICTSVGVASVFFALVFTNIYTIIFVSAVLYFVGQIAVIADELKVCINDLLETKYKINS